VITTTGTSVREQLIVVGGDFNIPPYATISTGGAAQPPQRRVGYFWLFVFEDFGDYRCYLAKRGAVYAPGTWVSYADVVKPSGYALRLDIVFDESGLQYTIKT